MTRIPITGWIVAVVLLAAFPASAETFHSQDGVVFEGTLRKVISGSAVCNVLQEKYSPEEYDRLKGNQGQPLDLWQADFAVRNESGRQIEHLRASGWVQVEHPPCTNWSGEGPGGGSVLPEPSLPIPIFSTDNYEALQMPYGMRPGQEVRRSFYLVVFHEHQPRFGEWDIDYRFAAGSGDAGERGGAAQSGRGPATAAPGPTFELPPEIQADRYLRQAEQSVRSGDAAGARAAMERLEALRQENGLEPAPEDYYRYAEAWEAAGEPERALASAARYLQLQGREAEHYTAALDLMNRAEFGQAETAAGPAEGGMPAQAPEPSCEGQAEGAACWKELASHPGCHVWDDHYYADQTVTWTGGCAGGLASGTGTLQWVRGSEVRESTGLLQDGKYEGRWVIRSADGRVDEGPFVDDKKNGRWVVRFADGGVSEGPVVAGKPEGHWVIRGADGRVEEGPFVDGKRNGQWVVHQTNGSVAEGPYVDGKRHGQWGVRHANGRIDEGPFVDGKQHGRWVIRWSDGTTHINTWVNDVQQ